MKDKIVIDGKVLGGNEQDKEFEIEEENLEVIVQDVNRTMQG